MPVHPFPVIENPDELFRRAHGGDDEAFEQLVLPWRRPLFAFLYRTVAHGKDAEDLMQEVLLQAFQDLQSSPDHGDARIWLFRIAAGLATQHLNGRRLWRPDAQPIAEQEEPPDAGMLECIGEDVDDPDFVFDIREHIAFCFSCVGRSIDPPQTVALMLHEILGLAAGECEQILGIEGDVLKDRLSGARGEMVDAFAAMCQFVSPKGRCNQCQGLRESLPRSHRGRAFPGLFSEAGVPETGETLLDARIRIVRKADLEEGRCRAYHRLLFDGFTHQEDPVR